jgi:type VI protein secretion system component VasK
MEDPFLNYFALGLLFFVVIVLVYGMIAIHDIPAKIAHARHHPHADAIHAAGWISLFLLHVLWPFLWIWAMMYQPDRGWGFAHKPGEPASPKEAVAELEQLRHRMAELEAKLEIRDRAEPSKGKRRAAVESPGPLGSAAEVSAPATEGADAKSRGARR